MSVAETKTKKAKQANYFLNNTFNIKIMFYMKSHIYSCIHKFIMSSYLFLKGRTFMKFQHLAFIILVCSPDSK